MTVSSRRAPWPYDLEISGVGVMCRDVDGSPLIGRKQQFLDNVAPVNQDYSSQPVYKERTFGFRRLILGMGERTQSSFASRRYRYALNVDCSIGGMPRPGPKSNLLTPSTYTGATREIRDFVEALHSSTVVLWALAGQHILRRTGDAAADWLLSKNFGNGRQITQAKRFKSSGVGATDCLYVTLDNGEWWRYDGSAWTQQSEIQTVVISGSPGGGTYTLTHNGNTTGALAYDASGAAVQAALRLLPTLGSVTVVTTGVSPDFTHTITFTGVNGNTPQLTSTNSLTGGVSPTITHATTNIGVSGYFLEVVGDELWVADTTSSVRKATADPFTESNLAAAIQVGDASSAITWMAQLHNRLFIFKDTGVFSLVTEGVSVVDVDLLPEMRPTRNAANGRGAKPWLDRLWTRYGDGFFYLTEGDVTSFVPIGPERMLDNDSEVRGRVQCSAGHQFYFLYEGVYNPQNGHSYLLKHGTWIPPESNEDAAYDFAEVPHGALVKWASRQVTSMAVSGIGGTNERLYVGFSDGALDFIKLPRGTPDPVADYLAGGECEFSTSTRELFWPLNHAMFQTEYKSFRGYSAFGPKLDSTNYVTQQYRTDPSVAYTTVTNNGTTNFITTGQRIDLEDNTVGKVIDCKTTLVGIPILEGMALHHQVRPILHLEYTATVIAADHTAKRDGSTDRKSAAQIRTLMRESAEAPGSVEIVTPDEETQGFSFIDYAEVLASDRSRYGLAWDIPTRFVQFKTLTVYGTIARLGPYRIGDLGGFDISQLGFL